jgi:hypothetical protein
MSEFKTREEYEKWKAKRLEGNKKGTSNENKTTITPQSQNEWADKMPGCVKELTKLSKGKIALLIIAVIFSGIFSSSEEMKTGTVEFLVALLPLWLILIAILWMWALIDIVKNEFTGSNKVIWLLMVIFIPILGFILYFLIGREQKIRRK